MRNDWSFFLTPQFLVGTLMVGLLINVLSAFVVRMLDGVKTRLTVYFRLLARHGRPLSLRMGSKKYRKSRLFMKLPPKIPLCELIHICASLLFSDS